MNVPTTSVSLTVFDPAASGRFLTTHLGFREVETAEGYVRLERDDAAPGIVLLERDPELPPDIPRGRGLADLVVCLTVTDIAAEYARLRAQGAPITVPLHQEPWGEWVLRLTDPNGVVVQLNEWIPPAGA